MMTADQWLAMADTLRSVAQQSGRDANASNLFVHAMLMRVLKAQAQKDARQTSPPRFHLDVDAA